MSELFRGPMQRQKLRFVRLTQGGKVAEFYPEMSFGNQQISFDRASLVRRIENLRAYPHIDTSEERRALALMDEQQ